MSLVCAAYPLVKSNFPSDGIVGRPRILNGRVVQRKDRQILGAGYKSANSERKYSCKHGKPLSIPSTLLPSKKPGTVYSIPDFPPAAPLTLKRVACGGK